MPARQHRLTDGGFVLDTRALGRRPGSMREVRRTVQSDNKIGLDLIAVPAGADVDLDLQLQAVSEGILVTGAVHAPTTGECARCLEPFDGVIDLQLTELFAYPDSTTEQTTEADEVYRMVDDDHIDLEPTVIDAVGLDLPTRPLCSDDCPGLCAECGIRLAIAESGHSHEILDPRWAGLASKFAVSSSDDNNSVVNSTRRDRSPEES